MVKRMLSLAEAADYLGISRTTLWRWSKDGKIPKGEKFGGRCPYWTKAQLDSFVRKRKTEGEAA
jgi:excisionase family DNA binding protein